MKDIMEFIKGALILAAVVLVLGSCSAQEVEERQSRIEAAREEGYNEGYDDGYERGVRDQAEKESREYFINGRSIRDVSEKVFDEYGMTPDEAFGIYDEYTYDSSHGGYTWKEYQTALEAMCYTSALFYE